jgi:hypothetical protein
MPWPDDPGSPPESSQRSVLRASPAKSPRFLRIGFVSVKALADCNKPFSRLYQHLGVYGHPYGLQDSLCTLHLFCSQKKKYFLLLRHRRNTRYGWATIPYPTGTCTLQDAPSFAWRSNAATVGRAGLCASLPVACYDSSSFNSGCLSNTPSKDSLGF